MRSLSRSISPALVRSNSANAALPTTRRGGLSVTPRTIEPPPSLASAAQYLTSLSKWKLALASLNSRCSFSLAFNHRCNCWLVIVMLAPGPGAFPGFLEPAGGHQVEGRWFLLTRYIRIGGDGQQAIP